MVSSNKAKDAHAMKAQKTNKVFVYHRGFIYS